MGWRGILDRALAVDVMCFTHVCTHTDKAVDQMSKW